MIDPRPGRPAAPRSVRARPAARFAAPALFAAALAVGTSPAFAGDCGNDAVHLPLLDLLPEAAATHVVVADGRWSDPAVWADGALPSDGADVLVPEGRSVLFDLDPSPRLRRVRVDGVLAWDVAEPTTMFVDTLFSGPSGEILVGTSAAPVTRDAPAEIVIIADDAAWPAGDPKQLGRGIVPHGPVRFVGAPRTAFVPLAEDVAAGANELVLAAPPANWAPGDRILLPGTFHDPAGSDDDDSRFHDEVLVITAIDGATVSFVHEDGGGARWTHARPDGDLYDPGELRIPVANLDRPITVRSEGGADAPLLDRGHVMVMHQTDALFSHVALVDLGRSDKDRVVDDPQLNVDGTLGFGTNPRGRYVLHFHRNLPQGEHRLAPGCAPAVAEGVVAWGSPGWGIVHHDSHCILRDNVVFDVVGSGIVAEAGNEIGVWERNLVVKTTGDDREDLDFEPGGEGPIRGARHDFGFNGESYWVQGSPRLDVLDNVAASSANAGLNWFSMSDFNANPDRLFIPVEHLSPDLRPIVTDGEGMIAYNRLPVRRFEGFEAFNVDFGFVTWGHMRNQGNNLSFTCPCDGNHHRMRSRFERLRLWNVYGEGIFMQYTSQVELVDVLVAAPPGAPPAVVLGINGSARGHGIGMNGPTKRLLLEGVRVEGWTKGVRTPREGQLNELDEGVGVGSEGSRGLELRASTFRDVAMANVEHPFYRRANGFAFPQDFANFLRIENASVAAAGANEPPIAAFTWTAVGTPGTVRLSGLASLDPDLPNDPDEDWLGAVTVGELNGIVSYAWDLDGDGTDDAWGEEVVHRFADEGPHPVRLTVWDHRAARAQTTFGVTPGTVATPADVVVDGDFDASEFIGPGWDYHTGRASEGWFARDAELADGRAILRGQQWGVSGVTQIVHDGFASRGPHALRFDVANAEGDDPDGKPGDLNRLTVRVFGADGEFRGDIENAMVVPYGAIPAMIEPLAELELSADDLGRGGEITVPVDLGPGGHRYLFVAFAARGVMPSSGDELSLDEVRLLPDVDPCPGDVTGDGLVGLHDLLAVITGWGGAAPGDADGDGVVDVDDLIVVLAGWGSCG